jgi:hypothetical protein
VKYLRVWLINRSFYEVYIVLLTLSAWNNLTPTGWIFMKFKCFSKSARKIQVSLKCDKNSGCFTWISMTFKIIILLLILFSMKCFRQSFIGSQNTHFMFSNFFYETVPFIYLFIHTYFHTSHSGTYHGNGKNHIHYTSSGVYNLIQVTAGWKEHIKTTVTTCII